jgi:hypothetical protein
MAGWHRSRAFFVLSVLNNSCQFAYIVHFINNLVSAALRCSLMSVEIVGRSKEEKRVEFWTKLAANQKTAKISYRRNLSASANMMYRENQTVRA